MLTLGILGWTVFLMNVDIYYSFIKHPIHFFIGSTSLIVGLLAIVMQSYTLVSTRRLQHLAWTVTFAVCFLTTMTLYTWYSWKKNHLPRTRILLLSTSLLGTLMYVLSYHIGRSTGFRLYGTLTVASVGQNLLIMCSLMFYVSTTREILVVDEEESVSLLQVTTRTDAGNELQGIN